MRVLLITDWNRGQGGAEAYISSLRTGLRSGGDEVRLLTSSAGNAADGSADYQAFSSNNLLGRAFLQLANPFAVAALRRALGQFRPEVVFVNMFAHHLSPMLLLALRGLPVVLSISDYKLLCPIGSKLLPDGSICNVQQGWVCHRNGCVGLAHWLRDRLRYALLRSSLEIPTRIVVCSAWMQRELAEYGIASDTMIWPVTAPSSSFHRRPASVPTFVFAGRLDREKGVSLLLQAFALVLKRVPAKLRIIGRGPERRALETLAGELCVTPDVTFTGWLDPPQVEAQLEDAWAVAVPSLWAEPLGLAAAEAVVRGVPVIASETGGLAEVVEPGLSGLLFPNGDEAALTDCMIALAEGRAFPDHVLAPEVVNNAIQRHSVGAHVQNIRRVFRELVSESSGICE